MSPTPPSTSSSTGAHSPEEQFRVVRKRNRVPLSCYPCRARKKCDRNHPCSNCTKREGMDTTSCSYAAPASRKKSSSQSQTDASPDDMRNRIDRLEGLVLLLMHGEANVDTASVTRDISGSRSATDSASYTKSGHDDGQIIEDDNDGESNSEDELATSLGVLKVDASKGKLMYVDQAHWHTILADISEVKNYFACHKKEIDASYERVKSSKNTVERGGPTLLLGAIPASQVELRAELPPKTAIITLCSRYFNSMDNAVGIIHGPTFFNQLKRHWEDPSKTSIMWLGMLYSILCLAMLSYSKVGDEPPEWKGRSLDLSVEYRLRTVQCLINADYTKPVEFTVETMLLYVFGEYSSRWDADVGLWFVVSLTVRIAFRMGYHRDAKWFPSISPFQAEMRRRAWALLRMADVVFSHQVSLPSMINEDDCDTHLPNNYLDDDIGPDMKELPPPRSDLEPTPISYLIAKVKLCNELGNILRATNRVGKAMAYDEVIRFDAKLRQIMQELPPHLTFAKIEGSNDPITLIVARFNIDILCQKILCLLHRNFVARSRQNPRYALSRKAAIEASMHAMSHLARLHRESQGNGKLRYMAWYVRSTATKEFLLPAMLISLDLHYDNLSRQSGTSSFHDGNFLWSPEQRGKMIESLENAQNIWSHLAHTSMEVTKGAKMIEIMLQKIKNFDPSGGEGASVTPSTDSFSTCQASSDETASSQKLPDPLSLRDLGGPATQFSPPPINNFMDMDFSTPQTNDLDYKMEPLVAAPELMQSGYPMFSNIGPQGNPEDLIANFDWGAFENYTQMATWGADQGFDMVYSTGDQLFEQNMDAGMMNGQ